MRIAVLSFAHERAATYVRLLRDRPDVDLVTADPDAPPGDPTRGRAMARRLGVRHADGWDEVFSPRLDAVVVTSETAHHRRLVERAAEVGAQVLCEQPLATREADAQAMIDVCARAGVGLTMACPLRFSPAVAAVRRAVADGDLGTLMTVHGVNNTANPTGSHAWTADPVLAGGGAVAANAACLTDLVDALLDGEPAEEVYAQANSILDEALDVESAALVTVRYPSGTVAAIDCSWSRPAAQSPHGGPTMTFIGDQANVEFVPYPRLLGGFDSAGAHDRWETGGADLDATMLDDFIGAVRAGRKTGPDGAAGLRTLRVILAAYHSLRTGQPVAPVVRAAHP